MPKPNSMHDEALLHALYETEELIVFDTETTGLKPKMDYIIELAAKKYRVGANGLEQIDTLHLYMKPPFQVSYKITELTGITNAQLANKPSCEEVIDEITEFFGSDAVVVGYNVKFDVAMLNSTYERCIGKSFTPAVSVDLLPIARELISKCHVLDYKLGTVAKYFHADEGLKFHSAIDDVEATKRVYDALSERYLDICCPWTSVSA